MSFNSPSQLWDSQLGVRFGALASLRQESSLSFSTSALGSDEEHGDTSVNSTQTSVFSTDVLQDDTKSFTISVPRLGPAILPDPNIATDSQETVVKVEVAPDSTGDAKKIVEPPSTPLEFNISRDEFLAARAAEPGSSKSHWSYTMYHRIGENGVLDNVKVHYCESKSTMERVCKEYFMSEDVIGFDLEWMRYARGSDGPRHNVSLIQIASPSRIGLFHVALFKDNDLLGPSFRKIMEDPKVSKVGVNIGGDCTRVKNHLGVTVRGIFELSHLYRLVKYFPDNRRLVHKGLVSLATQVEDQLLLPLYKGQAVRTGNWMRKLNPQQINYSASDAYAGLQLYYVLEEKRKAIVPCPPRPHHAELRLPIPLPDPPPAETTQEDVVLEDAAPISADGEAPATPRPKAPRPRAASSASKAPASEAAADTEAPAGSETPTPSKAKSKRPKPKDTRDARIIAAEDESAKYRSAKATQLETPFPCLRAYYIWYQNEDLCPADIAALLRDPPLLTTTVAHYVLDAIRAEKLPYPAVRLHEEVVPLIDLTKPFWFKHSTLVRECSEAAKKMKQDKEEEMKREEENTTKDSS